MSSKDFDWKVGDRRESGVHFLKMIEDLRNQFPYKALNAFLIEAFANSVDAGSTRIDIFIGSDIIKILDNGKGMKYDEFLDYHNLASETKTRGIGIGFAGVGAKIFLDKVYYIITETKSKNFHAATNWAFHGDKLRFIRIPVQNRVTHDTGTYVEAKIKDLNEIKNLTIDNIRSTLQQHYNAILQGHYGEKRITINNELILPFNIDPNNIEEEKEFSIKVGKNNIKGYIIKTKSEINELFRGFQIVVYGKTICTNSFNQYPTYSALFTGMFFADYLIDIVTTPKSDFNRQSPIWKKFNSRVGKDIGDWLDQIGAKIKLPEQSDNLKSLSQQIEKTVNELLKLPEFADIAEKFFQNIIRKNVVIKTDSGEIRGIEQEGGQINKGSLGGANNGEGLTSLGPDDNPSNIEDIKGEIPLERVQRRVRSGIKISYDIRPDQLKEAWIDWSKQTVTINQGHPSWKVAEKLNADTKSGNVTFYHILRSIFRLLAEEAGIDSIDERDKLVTDLFKSLYERLPKGR